MRESFGKLSNRPLLKVFLLFLLVAVGPEKGYTQSAQNYTTPGNLAPTRDPGCVALGQADNGLTPADLSLGILACAEQGNYSDAVDLFVLMQLRAVFDAKRVADPSAGQAGAVLALNVRQALGGERLGKFQAAFADIGGDGSTWHMGFCEHMQQLGVPDYFPRYMVQHGMRAFENSDEDPLVAGFQAQIVWQELLTNYLKCT